MIDPSLLTQPNIPKPLHGINPRTMRGKDWWDKVRKEAYKSTDNHCKACGIHKSLARYHKWLEAHEAYKIDYIKGLVIIEKIVPLCHACHNFIHSGRLAKIAGSRECSMEKAIEILEHGFRILAKNNLKCFPGTLMTAEMLQAGTYNVESYEFPEITTRWEDWRMIFEEDIYRPKFATFEEWREYYGIR